MSPLATAAVPDYLTDLLPPDYRLRMTMTWLHNGRPDTVPTLWLSWHVGGEKRMETSGRVADDWATCGPDGRRAREEIKLRSLLELSREAREQRTAAYTTNR